MINRIDFQKKLTEAIKIRNYKPIVSLFVDKELNYIDYEFGINEFRNKVIEANCDLGKAYYYIIKSIDAYESEGSNMLEFSKKAEKLFSNMNEEDRTIGYMYVEYCSIVYHLKEINIQELYIHANRGLELSKLSDSILQEIYFSLITARIYLEMDLIEDAKIILAEYLHKKDSIGKDNYTIVISYYIRCLIKNKERDKALLMIDECMNKFNDPIMRGALNIYYAELYLVMENFSKAEHYINEAEMLIKERPHKRALTILYLVKAKLQFKQKDFKLCIKNYLLAIDQLNYLLGYQVQVFYELSTAFAEQKHFAQAYQYLLRYNDMKDSVLKLRTTKLDTERETRINEVRNLNYLINYKTLAVNDAMQQLLATFNFNKIIDNLKATISKVVEADSVTLIMYNYETKVYMYEVDTHFDRKGEVKANSHYNNIAKSNMFIYEKNIREDSDNKYRIYGFTSGLYLPIRINEKFEGLLAIESYTKTNYADYELNLLKILTDTVAIATSNTRAYATAVLESKIDYLTEALNRRGFFNEAYNFFERKFIKHYLLIIDVDDLKQINDNFGHSTGDKVIQKSYHAIKNCTNNNALISRYGGDEFLVLIGVQSQVDAHVLCDLIMNMINVSAVYSSDDEKVTWTISTGVREIDGYESMKEAIEEADKMLYLAKKEGKNRVKFFK